MARIVEESECGFRVDPDDAGALAEEILRLALDRARARRLGENGRRWGERDGSLDRAAGAWEELLVASGRSNGNGIRSGSRQPA